MDYISYYERVKYLLELFEKGQAITPKIITEKFDCCDKTGRNMIKTLRELGYEIDYCKSSKKYIVKKYQTVNFLPSNVFLSHQFSNYRLTKKNKMKTKKLNSELFGKMELNQTDMKMVKGREAETVYSGSGRSGDGRRVHEYCHGFDDGSFSHTFLYAS